MYETTLVQCPRGHGDLTAVRPPTPDGAASEVGHCAECGGLWIPGEEVRHFFSPDMLVRFAESGATGSGPPCGRCTAEAHMSCYTFDGVEVDRCHTCFGLWLDLGELEGLGGGAHRDTSMGHCLFCARRTHRDPETGTTPVLCASCLKGSPLEVKRGSSHTMGMGGEAGDRITNTTIQGGRVQVLYDEEDESILFCWDGEIANSPVRCTVAYETQVTRIFRSLGFNDLELGEPAFDAQFNVLSSTPEETRDWLNAPGVRPAMDVIAREASAFVYVNGDGLRILGELPLKSVVPNEPLEQACVALYLSLRNS
ncbi:MAG TPA: hypothetical protein DIU15_17645 [Deltaproteobacteria bacterium]|nr:hypothetical protein [Deltaproteobacteria bacterium]HCP47867.1 hypothetical protein [Deltaproteobacteria bacterium]